MGSPSRLHLNSLQERGGENLQTLTGAATLDIVVKTVLGDECEWPERSTASRRLVAYAAVL